VDRRREALRCRWLPLLQSQQRRASSIGRLRCRAMVTAALPLRISLTLDQVHTTVVVRVAGSPRQALSVTSLTNPRRGPHCTHRVLTSPSVPKRPKTSQR